MPDLPSGTVTFLFTDIEGTAAVWERDRQAMATAVANAFPRHGRRVLPAPGQAPRTTLSVSLATWFS